MAVSGHGCVCCCVGPVIDVSLKYNVFRLEKYLVFQIRCVYTFSGRDMFLPSVYDAFVVTRPNCNFRDGIVVSNKMLEFGRYFVELPFNENSVFSLIHLISVNYLFVYKDISKQNNDIDHRDVMFGFAAVFIFIKSYASCLVAELSQLCYNGVLRSIALAATDGLCTFSCSFIISLGGVR